MRKSLLILSLLIGASAAHADIIINLTAGQLLTSGSNPINDGRLVQLLVDTGSNGFGIPSATSYTGGSSDDFIAASFALDSTTIGTPGDFTISLTFTLGGSWNPTDPLLLRWWPTLLPSATNPGGGGISYGEFRTNAVENSSSIAWFTPVDSGLPYQLNFITASQTGSQPDSAGVASLSTAAVPEPSTLAALGSGLLALSLLAARRKARP